MSDRSRLVGRFFSQYAHDFDSIYSLEDQNWLDRTINHLFRRTMVLRFLETLRHSEKEEIRSVLAIGCGPGRYLVEFLRQGKTRVVGLDMAEGMLSIAAEVLAEFDEDRWGLISGEYLATDVGEQFDSACLIGFLDYVEEPIRVFKKLQEQGVREIYASFPRKGGFLAWQRRARYRLRRCPLYLYSQTDVDRILDVAGMAGQYEIKDLGRDMFVRVVLQP